MLKVILVRAQEEKKRARIFFALRDPYVSS
jgi:hypothetical protein